jgi:hypothetical protein
LATIPCSALMVQGVEGGVQTCAQSDRECPGEARDFKALIDLIEMCPWYSCRPVALTWRVSEGIRTPDTPGATTWPQVFLVFQGFS